MTAALNSPYKLERCFQIDHRYDKWKEGKKKNCALLLHNDVALLLSELQQVGHLLQSVDTTHRLPRHHQALRRVRLHHWGPHSVRGYRQRGKLYHDWHKAVTKLQAQVYDILPSTTAVFSYAIGSRKLSANKQFFVGAQTAVSLLQTTQIISAVCFITDHVAYARSNKTKIIWIETEIFFFFLPWGGCASCLCACLGAR